MNQEPIPRRQRLTSFRLPYWLVAPLTVVAVVFVGFKVGTFTSGRMLRVRPQPPPQSESERMKQRAREAQLLLRKDPKVGTRLSLPPIEDLQGNSVQLPLQDSVTAVLYDRACCSQENIGILETHASAYPTLKTCVVFAVSDPTKVWEEIRAKGYTSTFLYDRGSELGRALNAIGVARLYIIGGDGTLLYVEDPTDPPEKTIQEAKEAVEKALQER